jgi:tetratricopeptide (TPR) repeat protein
VFCRLGTFALLILLVACQKKAENAPPPRYAVLRFENLSGDPGLDWTGRAISESLPVSLTKALDGPVLGSAALNRFAPALGARPASAPGASSERTEALAAGANRVISGYLERAAGQIRIAATEEDLSTGKSLRVVEATGTSTMAALDQLARGLSPQARHSITSNESALRAYATGLESLPAVKADLLEQAVHLDPNFGVAWVTLAGVDLALGARAAAEDVIERARHQKLDPLSQASLDMGEANLQGDRGAAVAGMRKVVSLSPGDTALLRSLAEVETAAGEFGAAAGDWKKATAALPNDPLAWNSLGYTLSYAGDYAGALAAFREYERLRPKDANPLDSIGDLNYSFSRFSDAAASYLQAHAKQSAFEQSGDLYKAAWAKFRAGDKQGADSLFSQFRTERAKANPSDQLIELLSGDWLYRTGREREAIAALRKVVSETGSAPLRTDARAQMTLWDLIQGDRTQAAKDAASIGPAVTGAPLFMARFAALPSAPAAEWELRADKMARPGQAALRLLALGYALVLDHQRVAALPVWERIVKASPATDFFSRAIYARLQGKVLERPLLPDPVNLNQFSCILERL